MGEVRAGRTGRVCLATMRGAPRPSVQCPRVRTRLSAVFFRAGVTTCRSHSCIHLLFSSCLAVKMLVILFSTLRNTHNQQQREHVLRLIPSSCRSIYVSPFPALIFLFLCILEPPIIVTGSRLLPSMFIPQVPLPLALHAVAEIDNAHLADVRTDNILNRSYRMARSRQQQQNGGFTAHRPRA